MVAETQGKVSSSEKTRLDDENVRDVGRSKEFGGVVQVGGGAGGWELGGGGG
jgi:hypothetical protein